MEFSELSFSVPWGIIQAKRWGNPSGKPFLGLHGWLDNANTFDKLAPLLPKDIYFVAIDFPGHGRSSCRPKGVPYTEFDWVIDVKWITSHLGWKRFSFIGHSMGAIVASLYACAFPNEVETAILIELQIEHRPHEDASHILANAAKFLTSNSGENVKLYKVFKNIGAAVARLMKANPDLTQESATILIQRRVINTDGGRNNKEIQVKSDPRLRYSSRGSYQGNYFVITVEAMTAILNQLECNIMVIFGKYRHPQFRLSNLLTKRCVDIMKKNASYFEQLDVRGNHFVHLNNPALIAQRIDIFLKKCDFKSKL